MRLSAGSALVMIVCLCAILTIATTGSWYMACLLHNAACVRQQVFVHKQAVKTLLAWALTQVDKQVIDAVFNAESMILYQGIWALDNDTVCNGLVIGTRNGVGIKVQALLTRADQTMATLAACLLYDTKKNRMIIQQWDSDEMVC